MKKFTILILLLLTTVTVFAQVNITGVVKSAEDGQPLPGASIIEKGTSNGASSDFDGNFSLNVANSDAILVVSYIGYTTLEIAIGTQTRIEIQLQQNAAALDEIVVVGYGTQKKSDVTGSVASVSKDRLEQVPNTNFTQALQGSVPGVSIVNNSANAEGNDVSIIIRGRNSISASNSPLVVLDGVPYSGSISDINPTDIQSIEILKDASSAAIYGSRGANGVILITSKKGKKGKTKISYDGFYGIEEVANLPDLLTPSEFYAFKNIREPGTISDSEEALFQSGGGTNWLNEALGTGYKQQHTLSVSGGGENMNYYVSGSYLNVEGVAVNDSYKRSSLRVNLESDITDWLTLGTNTQLSHGDRSGLPSNWGGDAGAFYMNPLTSLRDENGDFTIYPWPEEVFFGNPLQPTLAANNDVTSKVFTSNYINIDFPFIPGLSYKFNSGVEYTNRNRATYYGRNTKIGLESQGSAETQDILTTNVLIENIINYNREIGKHNLFATALYSYQNNEIERDQVESQGFPNDVLTWYQPNIASLAVSTRDAEEFSIISSMLRLNYSFDSRYLLTLTGRRDGFSGFGSDTKWGNFYSAAIGWNIHNEAFMEDSKFNTLKLRLSYGKNGNQAVGPYETLSRLSELSYLNGSNTAPGYTPSKLGNPSLGWESTTSYNIAVDYGLFNNRFRGSIDVYKSETEDLLLERQISPIHGINTITQNIGKTENFGIDFSLFADVVKTDNFRWNIGSNLTYNKNEIVDLYGNGEDDVLNEWFIGKPIRVNYGYQFDGVYQVGDDIANSAQPSAQPGYAKIVDQNGDGAIDTDKDRVVIGQLDPKYIAGLNMTFSYKNITLNIVSQGAFGVTKANTLLSDLVWGEVRRNTTNKNWWTPDNPTNSYWANHIDANINGVTIFEKADYWRLKDITLSYNLPTNIMDKIGLDRVRLYFTGRNLFTITKFNGLDPELTNNRNIPLQKTYTLGINIGL
ncbi:SusC/RagA family TonB-linked outer membrane protein [Flavivirga spongiicola]|uniref:TonB-dependent receptor n=1 Tax=Flavivirga spongiicola TaxID=421621 RepID=A0ABU7XWN8_9FLAO|nr:TonB-dependent receptor [Flavivirga sp. MEBiC05379]MDO5980196.1 TonB-dependent receptor [Flavivirga sp. MEBiC05379]